MPYGSIAFEYKKKAKKKTHTHTLYRNMCMYVCMYYSNETKMCSLIISA
jgi:hypothetical protein